MSNTSVPLSLAVCIRRSWASFPLPRLSCKTSIPVSQPPKLFPEDRVGAATRNMGDIFVALVWTRQAPRWCPSVPVQVSRGAAPPTGIFPVGVATATGPVAIPKAPEASGDFDVLPDAALHLTEAGEERAGPVACRSAQRQAQGRHNLFFFNHLVKVPNFERPCRDQGRNFCSLPDRPVELLAEGRNVSPVFEDQNHLGRARLTSIPPSSGSGKTPSAGGALPVGRHTGMISWIVVSRGLQAYNVYSGGSIHQFTLSSIRAIHAAISYVHHSPFMGMNESIAYSSLSLGLNPFIGHPSGNWKDSRL